MDQVPKGLVFVEVSVVIRLVAMAALPTAGVAQVAGLVAQDLLVVVVQVGLVVLQEPWAAVVRSALVAQDQFV